MKSATNDVINIWKLIFDTVVCIVVAIILMVSFILFNPLGLEDCTHYGYSTPCIHTNFNKIGMSLAFICVLLLSIGILKLLDYEFNLPM
jgi:hypothetical protein